MPALPTRLSWTALLTAWQGGAFTVTGLRDVALARLEGADAAALVPLSTLASLPNAAPRSDATPALETLARQHGWPPPLGRREWQAWTLRAALDTPQDLPRQLERLNRHLTRQRNPASAGRQSRRFGTTSHEATVGP